MAASLNELNKIGKCETKPKLNPDELKIGEKYPICDVKKVKGKFGDCVLVELEEGVIFLPKRMADNMSDDLIESIHDDVLCLALVYHGTKDTGKSNPAHLYEIVQI
ncbi:hypothetical protein Zmor_014882 [Zophobas morio]|uniref:Uncharacterized protein n=1 Tax=Zophobas morio TaxID=2755281 RepID=A0AA38ILM0_9CUCU|nr:hypothetical protein Zmor_014882 [Zophobas morio]